MRTKRSWQEFWDRQSSPLHPFSDEEHYRRLGMELQWLWRYQVMRSVLEVGCGDGSLFPYLGFEKATTYVGVDFSSSMLSIFKQRHPTVKVVEHDASTYCDNCIYDLIFSSQLAQYLSKPEIAQHISNSKKMLADTGLVVVASIPWRRRRFEYMRGLTGRSAPRTWQYTLRAIASILVKGDSMGHWYNPQDIEDLAKPLGLAAEFFGSMLFPYRFHAILTRTVE